MLSQWLDWLAPPTCAACSMAVARLRAFCPACVVSVERAVHERAHVRAAFVFGGALGTAIHRWKYQDALGVGSALCGLFASELSAWVPSDAWLVPVPSHGLRLAERGFNPPTLLAQALATYSGAKVAHLLRRRRETRKQSHLSRQERLVNLTEAFVLVKTPPPGGPLVLIDDVLTTGATLHACRVALGGARAVWAAVLAATPDPTSGKMRSLPLWM